MAGWLAGWLADWLADGWLAGWLMAGWLSSFQWLGELAGGSWGNQGERFAFASIKKASKNPLGKPSRENLQFSLEGRSKSAFAV